MRPDRQEGFTLVELLVSLAIASILLGVVYSIFVTQRRGHTIQEQVAEAQQNARVAADDLTRALQGIGNNVDRDNDQQQVLYCGPFEIIYNSNADDTLAAVTSGTTVAGKYTPTATYGSGGTGAETYRYSLDRNRDGTIDDADKTDGRHFNLYREVFWGNQSRIEEVALNLNVKDTSGNNVPLFRYWGDFDGDGTTDLWAPVNPLDPVSDISGKGRRLDQMIRHVEILVRGETQSSDAQYAALAAATGGFRQSLVQSKVTPRNLWSCPDVVPQVAASEYRHDAIVGTTLDAKFDTTYLGVPLAGREVFFTLSGPGAGSMADTAAVALTTVSSVSDAGGVATITLRWPTTCAAFGSGSGKPYFATLSAGGNLVYTLTATLPASATPLGECGAVSTSMTITVRPGPPDKVAAIGNPTPASLKTCETASSNAVFQVQNQCGDIPVPLEPGQQWVASTSDGQSPASPLGSVNPVSGTTLSTITVGATNYPFSFQTAYTPPAAPSPAVPPPPPLVGWALPRVGNDFNALVLAELVGPPGSPGSHTVTLQPKPTWLQNLAGPISGPLYDDCAAQPLTDTFDVVDCHGNLAYSMLPGFTLPATLKPDTGLGSLTSPATPVGGGTYSVTYTTPECTIGPPAGTPKQALFGIELKDGATQKHSLPAPFDPNQSSPTGYPINLQSCANCSVTFQDVVTPCTKLVPFTVSGCDLTGKPVTLKVTSTGGSAYLDIATKATTVVKTFGPGSSVTADLYIASAKAGDTFTVTATYTQNGANWTCAGSVTVTTECQAITIEHLNQQTLQWEPVDNIGGQNCLSRINEFRFTVEDCQADPTIVTLPKALTAYLATDDGSYLDYEELDLTKVDQTHWRYSGLITERNEISTPNDKRLTYPAGKNVKLVVAYKDTSGYDPTDNSDPGWKGTPVPLPFPSEANCRKVVNLVTPIPVCFPNAITSGGGGGWNGNFKVHWGDVVIKGDVELAPVPKFIFKDPAGQFDNSPYTAGAFNSDRFFDVYVGKSDIFNTTGGAFLDNSGVPLPNANPNQLDRPFLPGREGDKFSDTNGNYYRNISYAKITDMMRALDYEKMRELAIGRNVYWYTVQGTNPPEVRNPATNKQAGLETVLRLPGVDKPNPYYDGEFIFIDTYGTAASHGTKTGAQIDADALAGALPSFDMGAIYTEGVIYIAGSVNWTGARGGGKKIKVKSPPQYDMPYPASPYQHNYPPTPAAPPPMPPYWDPTESDLPIRPNPGEAQKDFELDDINIKGALYMDGEITFTGSPRVFGAISAERGFQSGGNLEVWYNYNLNVSNQDNTLCVNCCSVRLVPSAVTLPACATAFVDGVDAAGTVLWATDDPSVAKVAAASPTDALITGVDLGITRIKGVDANNCPAWTDVGVVPLTVAPASLTVGAGLTGTLQAAAPPGNTVTWTVTAGAASVSVTPMLDSRTVSVLGLAPGNATVEAQIGACAPVQVPVTVNP